VKNNTAGDPSRLSKKSYTSSKEHLGCIERILNGRNVFKEGLLHIDTHSKSTLQHRIINAQSNHQNINSATHTNPTKLKMVAIQSLIATIAFALAVNAAPSEVVARQGGGPQPGSNAAGLRFFTASDTDCDQNGGSFTQASVFVPQAGTSHPFLTGQCIQQATYGSVNVDFLLPTCQCESCHLLKY
jgi:hypothetical protein